MQKSLTFVGLFFDEMEKPLNQRVLVVEKLIFANSRTSSCG